MTGGANAVWGEEWGRGGAPLPLCRECRRRFRAPREDNNMAALISHTNDDTPALIAPTFDALSESNAISWARKESGELVRNSPFIGARAITLRYVRVTSPSRRA